MGFFSGVRRRIKKLIPKEVRPFVPYLATMIPGLQTMGPLSGIGSMAARKALIGGGTKFLIDDEADLKDIGITAALAAAPDALSEYGASSLPGANSFLGEGATTAGDYLAKKKFTTLAAQGGVDAGIKAAELNEEALERYNRELAEQGIADKASRRSAIRKIYEGTGTWDMDEVDSMLDTYGYRTGGRVGYEDGGETEEERAKRKRRKERRDRFTEGFDFAQEGLESLKELDDEIEPLPIRELRLARGGITDIEVEEGYDDGYGPDVPGMFEEIQTTTEEDTSDMMASNPEVMDSLNELSLMLFRRPLDQLSDDEYEELKDFAGQTSLKPGLIDEYRNYKYNAEEQGQTPMSPRDYFEMEFGAARMGVAKGGPIELNVNVGGNNMEDIKGQTAGPEWYQERIENLEFLFGDELTDDEIADIAYDSDKYYDKVGYDPMKKGGSVKKPKVKSIGIGKAKDYPGIKKILEMNKKGRKRYAEGGPMYSEEDFPILLDPKRKDGRKPSLYDYDGQYDNYDDEVIEIPMGGKMKKIKKKRKNKAEGGLMSMGGNEMDLRGGGFVPMGAKERADDVPARLSKNEFVMTADAVRGAGGGSVQKGADLMYDQMKRLEGQA